MAVEVRADTGLEFTGIERHGETVINPGVEGSDFGLDVFAARQEKDRHGGVLRAPLAAESETVRFWEATIKDEQVDPFSLKEGTGCCDGGHRCHRVAGIDQSPRVAASASRRSRW